MQGGKRIVPEVQWAIVHMSWMLDHDQISISLDVSLTTIKHVFWRFHTYETVSSGTEKPDSASDEEESTHQSNGHLCDVDVEVCHCIMSLPEAIVLSHG
jgi:hypothetical protein